MHVHEFEGAMFEDEIERGEYYMGRWTVVDRRCLYFSMK